MADMNELLELRKKVLEKEFERMNSVQQKAVFRINGPLLILAGAGSGKTTVLVNRIANMIEYGDAYNSERIFGDLDDDDINKMKKFVSDGGELDESVKNKLSVNRVKPWNILAITFILQEGMIVDTILYKIYGLISGVSPYKAILMLFAFVALLEFFIGSGTAKAFLIMPIVAPLAQLVGVSGNSLVLSFCMADGFTNMLYPTSGLMIIAIGLVNISYGKWIKFSWKLFALQMLLSVGLMFFAIWVGYR